VTGGSQIWEVAATEHAELEHRLEAEMDRYGLYAVLQAVEHICLVKADHVLTNWGDEILAAQWRHAGRRISRLAWTQAIRRLNGN